MLFVATYEALAAYSIDNIVSIIERFHGVGVISAGLLKVLRGRIPAVAARACACVGQRHDAACHGVLRISQDEVIVFSNILDWSDCSTTILFSDGAGAVILEASDTPGIHGSVLHSDGRYKDLLLVPRGSGSPADSLAEIDGVITYGI